MIAKTSLSDSDAIVGVMDTRQRDQLAELVDQATALEDLASKVQLEGEDDESAKLTLRTLERDYLDWHARALATLPDDLKPSFVFEYEGNFFQSRIKHFIQSGRQENLIWITSQDDDAKQAFGRWQYKFNDAFRGPLLDQKRILLNAVARYGASGDTINALDLLERVLRKLPYAIATLSRAMRDRPGITITDEYDLQRLMHAVLQLHFDDVRAEEPTPSTAGAWAKIDFLLPGVRVAIEAKMTRENLGAKKAGDELAADILRYPKHGDVAALLAVIYDPDRRIGNPIGFERDLRSDEEQSLRRAIVIQ